MIPEANSNRFVPFRDHEGDRIPKAFLVSQQRDNLPFQKLSKLGCAVGPEIDSDVPRVHLFPPNVELESKYRVKD
jgi:hypothetical protein